jgi:RHS repeat-associated protein
MSYGVDPDGTGGLQAGDLVENSLTRYTPFGDYRPGSSQSDITDRGFTGHKENDYIKLVDMKARWYAPAIGRFISPDTIVPDPTNPQTFNRYSYTNNNPKTFA